MPHGVCPVKAPRITGKQHLTDEAKFLNRPVASWLVEYEDEVVRRGTRRSVGHVFGMLNAPRGVRVRVRIDWLIPGISWWCHAISMAASRSSALVPCAFGRGGAAPHRRRFITT